MRVDCDWKYTEKRGGMRCGGKTEDFRLRKSPSFQDPHYNPNPRYYLQIFKCSSGFRKEMINRMTFKVFTFYQALDEKK